jgi:hypothetical protein
MQDAIIERSPVQRIKSRVPGWVEKPTSKVPLAVRQALREAMTLEGVAPTQYDDLLWLVAQESGGEVDARNPRSSARGLFQLLKAQYGLNPHGEASFGNAKEECQGGIRYVVGRYRTAHRAREFWLKHHWY